MCGSFQSLHRIFINAAKPCRQRQGCTRNLAGHNFPLQRKLTSSRAIKTPVHRFFLLSTSRWWQHICAERVCFKDCSSHHNMHRPLHIFCSSTSHCVFYVAVVNCFVVTICIILMLKMLRVITLDFHHPLLSLFLYWIPHVLVVISRSSSRPKSREVNDWTTPPHSSIFIPGKYKHSKNLLEN